MIALLVIAAVLVLLLLLPVGAALEYGEDGVTAQLLIGFVRLRLFPRPPVKRKKTRNKTRKAEKSVKQSKQQKPEEKKGGKLPLLMEMLRVGIDFLGAFRRRLLVRRLTLRLTYGGADPAATAIRYGQSCAAAHALLPLIDQVFRVRRQDVRLVYDPAEPELSVYVHAALTIRVGQLLALAARYGMRALKIVLAKRNNHTTEDKAVS